MNLPTTTNIDKIKQEIIEIKKELLDLKIKAKTKQNIKSHLFKYKKRQLARLYTMTTQINK